MDARLKTMTRDLELLQVQRTPRTPRKSAMTTEDSYEAFQKRMGYNVVVQSL